MESKPGSMTSPLMRRVSEYRAAIRLAAKLLSQACQRRGGELVLKGMGEAGWSGNGAEQSPYGVMADVRGRERGSDCMGS